MSYLDPPRFSFSGLFTANPPTINNFTPNYADPTPSQLVQAWNASGIGTFGLTDVTVTGACLELGTPLASDPILGATLSMVPASSSPAAPGVPLARLVDLDPDQQMRTMIVGLALQLSIGGVPVFTGTVAPMTIIDLWSRVHSGSAASITFGGAMYQSVIQNVVWSNLDTVGSPLLSALQQASPTTLSIKFNVDQFGGQGGNPGRFVGTIGPYGTLSGGIPEPLHVLAQRRMYPGAESVASSLGGSKPVLNPAPFQVKDGFLTIDLGNSVPTTAAATVSGSGSSANITFASFFNLGPAVLLAGTTALQTLFTTPDEFGANYTTAAGIYDVPLNGVSTDDVVVALQIGPTTDVFQVRTPAQAVQEKMGIVLASVPTAVALTAPAIAMAENDDGSFASFDFNALRLAFGVTPWAASPQNGAEITADADVPFYATVFGAPAANMIFQVQTASNFNQMNTPGSPPVGPQFVSNAPASAIDPPPSAVNPPASGSSPAIHSIETDANGRGTFTVTANPLTLSDLTSATKSWRTENLDSQLYLYTHDGSMDTLQQPLTVLVFVSESNLAPGQSPTWANDVGPIFREYAALYPGMLQFLDLSDFQSVVNAIPLLQTIMNLPLSDPAHMPVTRDLSPANLAMINQWFTSPV